MLDLDLRPAVAADIPTLKQWDVAPHVVAISGDDEPWNWVEEINVPWQQVWIAEVDEDPIGVVVLLDAHTEPSNYWGDVAPGTYAIDIWIGEADYLHRGYGTQMMRHTIDRAFNVHGARTILIDPLEENTDAIGFYKYLGFEPVGPRRFGADDCLVLQLVHPAWLRGVEETPPAASGLDD